VAEVLSELLARCRRGEDDAVETLVARFSARALDLAAALLGDAHLAEDAVQEAFLVALQRLADLRDPSAFPGWLRQIVRSQCTRILRKRRERLDAEIERRAAAGQSPAAAAELAEMRAVVRAALAALPPVGRRTAELFYLEEQSCAEIAEHLHVPLGTVKRRLHDARAGLRDMLLGVVAPVEESEERPSRGLPF